MSLDKCESTSMVYSSSSQVTISTDEERKTQADPKKSTYLKTETSDKK
jgi:hypothetical protein